VRRILGADQHRSAAESKPECTHARPDDGRVLAEQRERPLGTVLRVEREQQDPLPLAEAQCAVGNRDLLRARAEEEREQLLSAALARRDDALEQRFEILEETRLPLLHADDRVRAVGMEERDAVIDRMSGDRYGDLDAL
jgi:hypothetical protein